MAPQLYPGPGCGGGTQKISRRAAEEDLAAGGRRRSRGGRQKKISRRAAEEDVAKARYAIEHVRGISNSCSGDQVSIKLSHSTRLCVEPKHALEQIDRRFKCPAGFHVRVDLAQHTGECRAVVNLHD
jgi:hypothetical protein